MASGSLDGGDGYVPFQRAGCRPMVAAWEGGLAPRLCANSGWRVGGKCQRQRSLRAAGMRNAARLAPRRGVTQLIVTPAPHFDAARKVCSRFASNHHRRQTRLAADCDAVGDRIGWRVKGI